MKRLAVAVIFILAICMTLAGCGISPYGADRAENVGENYFDIYVCGAVEREGYYRVKAGTSCTDVIALAGILPQSMLPAWYTDTVTVRTKELVVNYYDGEQLRYCVNANSPEIAYRMSIDGIPDEVVALIADYTEAHGTICNKAQLSTALGEWAEEYCYRFYVAAEDYEAAD